MGLNNSDSPEMGLNQADFEDVDAGGTMGLKREDATRIFMKTLRSLSEF